MPTCDGSVFTRAVADTQLVARPVVGVCVAEALVAVCGVRVDEASLPLRLSLRSAPATSTPEGSVRFHLA